MAKDPVFSRADRERQGLATFSHPLNPGRSEMRGVSLSEAVGLERLGVHLAVLPPGKESFVYHAHLVNEEWMFVLSGRGQMEIDGKTRELAAGDFVGFATPSAAHQLHNPYEEELTYLTGGERGRHEVAEFPRLGKLMVYASGEAKLYALEGAAPMAAHIEGEKK